MRNRFVTNRLLFFFFFAPRVSHIIISFYCYLSLGGGRLEIFYGRTSSRHIRRCRRRRVTLFTRLPLPREPLPTRSRRLHDRRRREFVFLTFYFFIFPDTTHANDCTIITTFYFITYNLHFYLFFFSRRASLSEAR